MAACAGNRFTARIIGQALYQGLRGAGTGHDQERWLPVR